MPLVLDASVALALRFEVAKILPLAAAAAAALAPLETSNGAKLHAYGGAYAHDPRTR